MPISKELDNGKTITYILKLIDRSIFISTSLSKRNGKDVRKGEKSIQYAILLDLTIIN